MSERDCKHGRSHDICELCVVETTRSSDRIPDPRGQLPAEELQEIYERLYKTVEPIMESEETVEIAAGDLAVALGLAYHAIEDAKPRDWLPLDGYQESGKA